MKFKTTLCCCLAFIFTLCFDAKAQVPPYSGTIFMDSNLLTTADASTFQAINYVGQGNRTVFDRRTNSWTTIYAFLYDITFSDGLTSQAVVNPEFGTTSLAYTEAYKYANLIGQLPKCLRVDVNEIWIHKGNQPFGGGNNSILIHTDKTPEYESYGNLEETLFHEACHTSLDATHANASGWLAAQTADGNFISTYARDNPLREDIAESFLTWFAVRYRQSIISSSDYNTIVSTIPNRLLYFDGLGLDMSPIVSDTLSLGDNEMTLFSVFPNPVDDILNLKFNKIHTSIVIEINDLYGKQILHERLNSTDFVTLDSSLFPKLVIVKVTSGQLIQTVKLIKQN